MFIATAGETARSAGRQTRHGPLDNATFSQRAPSARCRHSSGACRSGPPLASEGSALPGTVCACALTNTPEALHRRRRLADRAAAKGIGEWASDAEARALTQVANADLALTFTDSLGAEYTDDTYYQSFCGGCDEEAMLIIASDLCATEAAIEGGRSAASCTQTLGPGSDPGPRPSPDQASAPRSTCARTPKSPRPLAQIRHASTHEHTQDAWATSTSRAAPTRT